jgi:hypothetical protein|tara:strand:- start:935 stop:1501 length:567 start_codon:yes stop_codon:yes gene_type:complete
MSTLKVSTISPLGTDATKTITVGASGDTFKLTDGITVSGAGANTPAFKAILSGNKTISASTDTKIQFDSEVFDTDNAYDPSTNYRFTVPSGKGGKYYVTLSVHTSVDGSGDNDEIIIATFVNGAMSTVGAMNRRFSSSSNRTVSTSGILTLSAGDYVEAYVYNTGGTTVYKEESWAYTFFSGYRLIGA